MKELLTKTLMYCILAAVIYSSEHEIPYKLVFRRFMYLQSWALAAFCQKLALKSYIEYRKEAEING